MSMVEVWHKATGGALKRFGRPDFQFGTRDWRASLEPGTYLPSEVTNGLIYGTDIASMTWDTTIGSGTRTLTTTPVSDTVYWGKIKCARNGVGGAGSSGGNIVIAGPRPDLVTEGDTFYLLSCYDPDSSQATFDDILIDPFLWTRADAPGGPWSEAAIRTAYTNSVGIKGNGITLRNALVRHCQDQWQGTLSDGADARFTLFDKCWFDTPLWRVWSGQAEGTHSDCAQPQTGANVTMLGGMLGGSDMPESLTSFGTCLTWKQEVSADADHLQHDVTFDRVIMWSATGGNPTANVVYNLGNDFVSNACTITGCLFVERADGEYVNMSDAAVVGVLDSNNVVITDPSSGSWTEVGTVTYSQGW